MNLTTNYLGMLLKNPIVASSSPLSHSVDSIRRLEDAGAAAVVMYSLFEEQIGFDSYYIDYHLTQGIDSYAESISYFPDMQSYNVGPDEYLVPGDLSVADWMDAFGAKIEATHTTTVAGLLAASLKRLPREGDQIRLAHLLMRVDSMRGRRVDRVRLKLLEHPQDAAPVDVEGA